MTGDATTTIASELLEDPDLDVLAIIESRIAEGLARRAKESARREHELQVRGKPSGFTLQDMMELEACFRPDEVELLANAVVVEVRSTDTGNVTIANRWQPEHVGDENDA